MASRRRAANPADVGGTTLQAVLFDLMRTLVAPLGTYGEQLAHVYHVVGGVLTDPDRALAVTEEVRQRTQRTDHPENDWAIMNRKILAILASVPLAEIPIAIAQQVRPRLMSDPDLYQVRPEMRALLEHLGTRVPLGLASNYDGRVVDHFLDHFDLRRYFRGELIFVSGRIAGAKRFVDKPTAEFWQIVRATIGCPDNPRVVALVDDDTRVAVPVARFGHPVALLDYDLRGLDAADRHPLLFYCRSCHDVECALFFLGLPR